MAEKRTIGHAYNIDFLNVVFAASSLLLFFGVLWMVWDDYDREWKDWQRRFAALERQIVQASIRQAERQIDRAKLRDLEQRREAARRRVEAQRDKVEALRERLGDVNARLYRVTQDFQFAKAEYDADKYAFEELRVHDPERARRRQPALEAQARRLDELQLIVERTTAERDRIQAELGQITGGLAAVERELAELTAERDRLRTRLAAVAPGLIEAAFRNAPLLDFMAPTLRIQQVITPNVLDDVNFTRVPKMDRCMTCHLAIDRPGYEDRPQPFRTHPNLDLYVGSASPHPLTEMGCTVCHEGMGQSVTFVDAAHTPADDRQRRLWEERYDWHPPHYWDYPMLPRSLTEASCAKCHRGEVFVPRAARLNRAYGLFERAGCYACHKTRGFENLRRPGPSLRHIGAKLSPEWVKTWIRRPAALKPTTWMPQVWYNSNSSSPEDARRNEVEIEAATAYLFANDDPYQFPVPNPPRGNAEAGRRLVETVGCKACHITQEEHITRAQAGPRRTFGQPLVGLGDKTTYVWIFNWVRDPRHYSPETYMPNLRLTDREAADIAAYLASLKGPAGEPARAAVEPKLVDTILFEYLANVIPADEARARIARMDAEARKLELGRRVIARYGCFSCHEIKGFENEQPIGTELSEAGSKLVAQLDFAFVDIPHTKIDWYRQKLLEPRIFDRGRVLRPLEKLRMPNFHLAREEAELLVTALMSFQRDVQPRQIQRPRSLRGDALVAGRNFVRRRNCVACHEIEGDGGDYRALVADPSTAPPMLTPQGAKVRADWMYAFLRSPIRIRPWLEVRMPTFDLTDDELNTVIRYFGAVSNTMRPFVRPAVVQASDLTRTGRELFELLKCQQCHVLGTIPADQPTANLAPDLRMAPERLQPDWILEWLKNPAAIQPGTRMPAFWPDYPKSYYPHLNGSAEQQIRAVRDYLMTLRGGPSPKPAATRATND
ncbi:MAG TPA: c-type cytochrome [Vicinamibacterales bacterium]|nr:c-type cytochrome [Vicinamibacterales bacterium]